MHYRPKILQVFFPKHLSLPLRRCILNDNWTIMYITGVKFISLYVQCESNIVFLAIMIFQNGLLYPKNCFRRNQPGPFVSLQYYVTRYVRHY